MGEENFKYTCRVCGKKVRSLIARDGCEKSHETVIITLYREDLYKLLSFIMTKDESWLTERLVKTLQQYNSGYYLT